MFSPIQTYRHKQFSPWPLLAFGLFFLRKKKGRGALLSLAVAVLTMQFCALATRVDEHGVSWNFGLSLPLGEIPFDQIAGVEMTQTRFWEGFGIHWTPRHGWLWNVGGRDAVTIRKKDGGIVTLGSDDAAGLYAAITTHMSRAQRFIIA
jgi:hypothetical protein